MTFPKFCKNNHGIISADILLALSMAVLFTALITESSLGARDIFERAKARKTMLDDFENGTSSESRTIVKDFGNEMVQKDSKSQDVLFTLVSVKPPYDYSGFAGTSLCSIDFFGKETVGSYRESDFKNVKITPIVLPVNPLLPLSDLEVRNGVAYVSDDSATASDPDLFIVDIRDTANPVMLSSVNTGPGIAAIAIAGKRIFAAASSAAAELHVIRLDGLGFPVMEKKFQLPLPYATATPPFASAIFYRKGFIYIGTEKWDGDEFSILNVSDPTKPVKVGGLEVGSKVNDIFARNGTVYIADSDGKELRVFDSRDILNPIPVNFFHPSGANRQEGKTISFFENSLVFGRTSGGFDIASDHEIFAFASTSLTTLSDFVSMNVPGGVYGVIADRSRLYVVTREVDKEFQIIDRTLGTSTAIYYPLPVAPQTIVCDRDKLYVLSRSAPVIYQVSFN